MLKILILEDEESLLQLYSIVLQKEGFETFLAHNGQEAWNILEKQHIDMVITDILMPVMNGYDFVELVRKENPTIPILMITAKDDFVSKSRGFSLGTDDYMTKPIDLNEMVLRVKALLRRANVVTERKLILNNTLLEYDALTVTSHGDSCMLPQKEFYLLYKLISYPNKIFTRVQLMDEIWGRDNTSDLQTIDVHINRLRRRFQDNPDFEIMTVRGLGYKAVIH
ncbi:MAG: response regulator transcription factor [bacterium]|nr:response regulator transcription factor [bacterium]